MAEDLGPCELWQGSTMSSGYGQLYLRGLRRYVSAHRFCYEQEHGPIPPGMVVRHRCDNPRCVRLDHLVVGTPAQNTADMVTRGRWAGGRPRAVTPEIAAVVREMADRGLPAHRIAAVVGVSASTVSRFLSNQRSNR